MTYHDLVNADGTYNAYAIHRVVMGNVDREQQLATRIGNKLFSRSDEIAYQIQRVYEWAKALHQAEFEWKNYTPMRTVTELKLAA